MNFCGLLRPGRHRPRRRAAEQRDELAAFQLIELHLIPASQCDPRQPVPASGYRIGRDQSRVMNAFYKLPVVGEGRNVVWDHPPGC
jgi:hypothetical protein